MEGHRDWYRNVDPDHADLDAMGEFTRRVAIPRKDGSAIAKRVLIDDLSGSIEAVRAHDREYGTKDLFFVDLHIGGDLVEEGAADEEPTLIALHFEIPPVHHELRAFGNTGINIGRDLL